MPYQQLYSKTEKPISDPGHNPCLSSPHRARDNFMPSPVSTQTKPFPVQSRLPITLAGGDPNVVTMSSQHCKELLAKLTSSLPKPYGTIPSRHQNRKTAKAPSRIMRDNIVLPEEKDDFGALPSAPPFGSRRADKPVTPRLTKRMSMPGVLPKSSPSTSDSVNKSGFAVSPLKRTTSTPSRCLRPSPNSLRLLSTNTSPPLSPSSSTSNRFLYKFSISPPSSTYATLRSLNPFSATPPASASSAEKKSPLSQPVVTSPAVSLGRFFTFLDDVAPVVAAAGGELVGISEMPKWAGMGGTTSATVSTLSLLLRNNDRLRGEMQLDNLDPSHTLAQARPASSSPIKKCPAPPSPSPSAAAAAAAAAGAPPAPLVIPGAQHLYLREPRLNPAYLRMMAAEMNMMRAGKLVGPLRPRGWLPRRRDPWDHKDLGHRSDLRHEIDVAC